MRFKVVRKTYIQDTLYDVGAEIELDEDELVKDEKGKIRFEKYPALVPMDKKAAKEAEKAQIEAHKLKADTDAGRILNDPPAGAENGGEELSEEEKAQAISDALDLLDAENDEQWTAKGLPAVDAVIEIVGFEVTRKEIEAASPEFTRPQSE